MSDKPERFRGEKFRRQRSQGLKAGFPLPEFNQTSKLGIKQIAYLHRCCRIEPHLIAAKYPKALTLADVHLALAHYFRDPEPIDDEIKRELAFHSRESLSTESMTLPRPPGLP